MASSDINWNATLSASSGTVAPMYVTCLDTTGVYVLATVANLAAVNGLVEGVILDANTGGSTVRVQYTGSIPRSQSLLGTGAATTVGPDGTGKLVRGGTPSVGNCNSFGDVVLGVTSGNAGPAGPTGPAGPAPAGTGPVIVTAGAASQGAVFLAGGASWVTGVLPLANEAAPTGTGIPHVIAGTMQGATSLIVDADVTAVGAAKITGVLGYANGGTTFSTVGAVDTLLGANSAGTAYVQRLLLNVSVDPAAAIAGTKIAPAFGAQNVSFGTSQSLIIGATPASAGVIRSEAVTTWKTRNVANSFDYDILTTADGGVLTLGGTNVGTLIIKSDGSTCYMRNGTTDVFIVQAVGTSCMKPIWGSDGASAAASPYSVHGTVISAMTNADYTVPATEYKYSQIEVPVALTLGAARKFKLPTPATEAVSYWIRVRNLTTGGFPLTVTRADGDTTAATSVPPGTSRMIRVRPAGTYDETV